ncbi:unnamed protein product [Pipistrellus nathusii]|uniref:Uncharacterized protein n=1 Tax=Pipistrellus nathusii TaxID=59473 RepID=A0ABN9Z5B7_PIPNA
MASPVLEKQRGPRGSMWADRTPEDPLGARRRRGEGDGGRGSPAPITWPRHLAGPGPRQPGAGLGSPQLRGARPPTPRTAATNSPAFATAPPQPVSQTG